MTRIPFFILLSGFLVSVCVAAARIGSAQPPIPPQLPTEQTDWGRIESVLHTNVAFHSLTINGVTVTNDITLITVNTFYQIGFRNDGAVVWRKVAP